MKFIAAAVTVVLVLSTSATLAQTAAGRWGACARFHAGHGDKAGDDNIVPYDGDWSYGLVYEYREPQAMFQIIMSATPSASFKGRFDGENYDITTDSTNTVSSIDSILTPEFNLIFTEGAWTGGMGILKHLVKYSKSDGRSGSKWSPVFWQIMTGITLGQKAGFAIDLTACYEFRSLKNISDIDINDIDVRLSLTKKF